MKENDLKNRIPNRQAVSILIGTFMVLWGILWSALMVYMVYMQFSRYNNYFELTSNPDFKVSIWKLIWTNHVLIISGLLAFIGGLGMLLRKKIGWIIIAAISVFDIIYFTWMNYKTFSLPNAETFMKYFAFTMSFVFLLSAVAIVLPQIRNRYTIKSRELLFALSLLVILILDFILF